MLELFGIGLGFLGIKMLHDNIEYTKMDLKIGKASPDLKTQYKQIDANFREILMYSGAKCDIKKNKDRNYQISNVKKGQYGGMERYLAEKGFYPKAINYAKERFDKIADKEQEILNNRNEYRIKIYESQLSSEECHDKLLEINIPKRFTNSDIEREVERLTKYFNSHRNWVYCNIITEGDGLYYHHKEIWHIKEPIGGNAENYYYAVCSKLNILWSEDYSKNREFNKSNFSSSEKEKVLNESSNEEHIEINPTALRYQNLDKSKYNVCNECGESLLKKYSECPYCGSTNIKQFKISESSLKEEYDEYAGYYDPYAPKGKIETRMKKVIENLNKTKSLKKAACYSNEKYDTVLKWYNNGKRGYPQFIDFYNEINRICQKGF